jgi:hypothetical protein
LSSQVPIAFVVIKSKPLIEVERKSGSLKRVINAFETRYALPSRPFVNGKLPALKFATSSVIFVGVGIGHESSSVFRTEAYRTRL